jgi:hypothetical protein
VIRWLLTSHHVRGVDYYISLLSKIAGFPRSVQISQPPPKIEYSNLSLVISRLRCSDFPPDNRSSRVYFLVSQTQPQP